ncbi:MAG: hypothetical protein HFI87_04600 [Bacilli bacterium]|nr:hypothetical protein [Bacilli bacterium]
MEYSKLNSNNCKGLKITIGTSICKVNTYNFVDTFASLDDKTIEKRLLQLQRELLQITKHAVNISARGCSYIKASKPKRK